MGETEKKKSFFFSVFFFKVFDEQYAQDFGTFMQSLSYIFFNTAGYLVDKQVRFYCIPH